MKKSVTPLLLIVLFLILVTASCKYSFTFDYNLKKEVTSSSEKWTKLGARDREGYQLKLIDDSVFYLDELMNVNLRSVVNGPVMIVEIDRADCESCIQALLDILKEEKYKTAKHKNVVLIAGGYTPRDGLLLKRNFEIPFKIYTTDTHLRELSVQDGPKLFVVDSVYTIRDKFVPNFEKEDNIRLYLDQILCGEKPN